VIGDFVPGRHPGLGVVLLLSIQPTREDRYVSTAIVADTNGNLHVVGTEDLSIDWHYDNGDGRWKPDFEETP
jgi:hypothetical protein